MVHNGSDPRNLDPNAIFCVNAESGPTPIEEYLFKG
jgi:hypothetical protein